MMRERGYTVVELIVAVSVAAVVMSAAVGVVVRHRRFYTTAADVAAAMGTLNHLEVVLGSELLPINASAGDLIHAGTDSMATRLFMGVYSVCEMTLSPISFTVLRLSRAGALRAGDSAVVYSRGPGSEIADDLWEHVKIGSVSTGTCPDGSAGWTVEVEGLTNSEAAAVPPGAPLRAFTRASYSFVERSNGWFLVRSAGDGPGFPVAGPLLAPSGDTPGLRFRYLDASGQPTAVESEVARVEVVAVAARSVSGTRGADPTTVSRTVSFTFRNN